MRIVIFGPQGSGKGTQAELIARRHGWPYISTGDIFRYHLKNQTELGNKIQPYINAGNLVPDDLTNHLVKERLQQPDCEMGFVLDGYPRNQAQLEFLNSLTGIDLAIAIELNDSQAIERLANRLACKCGMSYHTIYNKPKVVGICDKCGGRLFKREDDNPGVISQRLGIFHHETEPLFRMYSEQGVLHRVDGSKQIEEVYQSIDYIIHQK